MTIPELPPLVWFVSAFVFLLGVVGFVWRSRFAEAVYGLWTQFDNPQPADDPDVDDDDDIEYDGAPGSVHVDDLRFRVNHDVYVRVTVHKIFWSDQQLEVCSSKGVVFVVDFDEVSDN